MIDPDRWAWAEIDLDAIEHNVRVVRELVAPSEVWGVVKAAGYGHGAVDVARAALAGGASGLCVALVGEGVELREAGIDVPILLLSEQPPSTASTIVELGLTPSVYTARFIDALAAASPHTVGVHLKVDTGMQRVGVSPSDVDEPLARLAANAPRVRLDGVYTHLAVADDDDEDSVRFTDSQLARFDALLATIDPPPLVHLANSAGALARADVRRDLVRLGIAMYGISPGDGVDHLCGELRPALSLRARVSFVKRVRAGTGISYGLRHRFAHDTNVATVPLGYADGVPRRLGLTGGEVLVGGRRRPMVGVVTMDQLMVDCGDDEVSIGDDVTLIGSMDGPDGVQWIRAEDWARRLDTIGYEIVCGISGRVPRRPRRSIPR